jgi:hypothetical protein
MFVSQFPRAAKTDARRSEEKVVIEEKHSSFRA